MKITQLERVKSKFKRNSYEFPRFSIIFYTKNHFLYLVYKFLDSLDCKHYLQKFGGLI
jgi:hypothetical protein